MQESGERKVQGRATWAADSTAGPPAAWAGRSPGSRAGARGTPVPAQPPTSSGPCRSLEEASVSPSVRQSPPEAVSKRIPVARFRSALTGGSPAWSGTSSPGRQAGPRSAGRPEAEAEPAPPPAPGPVPERRPARELPGPHPAHLVLGQQLLGQAAARAPHRAQFRQLVSGRRQLSHFRPRAASPPRPRGNRP